MRTGGPQRVRAAHAVIPRCSPTFGRTLCHKITSAISVWRRFTTPAGGICYFSRQRCCDSPCGRGARHEPPSSNRKAYGSAARTHHAVHAMAAGAPGPSGSPPRDERGARDRLGVRAGGAGRALWPVRASVWRPLGAPTPVIIISPPAVYAHPALQASGPPAAASSWDACGTPTRALLPFSPRPGRLAPGRPDAPRAYASERAATPDLSDAPGDGSHHHPSLPWAVTLPPARSRAHATADGPGVLPEPPTPARRCLAGCEAVPARPTLASDTPEGPTWVQPTAAWFPGLSVRWPHP